MLYDTCARGRKRCSPISLNVRLAVQDGAEIVLSGSSHVVTFTLPQGVIMHILPPVAAKREIVAATLLSLSNERAVQAIMGAACCKLTFQRLKAKGGRRCACLSTLARYTTQMLLVHKRIGMIVCQASCTCQSFTVASVMVWALCRYLVFEGAKDEKTKKKASWSIEAKAGPVLSRIVAPWMCMCQVRNNLKMMRCLRMCMSTCRVRVVISAFRLPVDISAYAKAEYLVHGVPFPAQVLLSTWAERCCRTPNLMMKAPAQTFKRVGTHWLSVVPSL